MTLGEMDRFILTLQQLADRRCRPGSSAAAVSCRDAHDRYPHLGQWPTIAIGAEADLLTAWLGFAQSVGLQAVSVVSPVNQLLPARLPVERVQIGDLQDLQMASQAGGVDLLLANSHGADPVAELGAAAHRLPHDQMGEFRRTRQGLWGIRDPCSRLAT